jgi:hypothetical protein
MLLLGTEHQPRSCLVALKPVTLRADRTRQRRHAAVVVGMAGHVADLGLRSHPKIVPPDAPAACAASRVSQPITKYHAAALGVGVMNVYRCHCVVSVMRGALMYEPPAIK